MIRKFREMSLGYRILTIFLIQAIVTNILLRLKPFGSGYYLEFMDLFGYLFLYLFFSTKAKYSPSKNLYFQANRVNPVWGNRYKIIVTSILFLLTVMFGKAFTWLNQLPWLIASISILVLSSSFYITNYSSYILGLCFLIPFYISNINYQRMTLLLIVILIVYFVATQIESKLTQK